MACDEKMVVKAARLENPLPPVMDWDLPPWRRIEPERLRHHMGERPGHFPKTGFKIAYDDDAIHVMFRVEDQFVRAVAAGHQEPVCADSCVEFFFTPGPDVDQGYFNLEMNCGGTMLFRFNAAPRQGTVEIPAGDCEAMTRTHSLPRLVDPEITEPVTWTVGYSIPLDLLRRYGPVAAPRPQARWRVNFFKCADKTSHPHWLTWAPVDDPKPNFHLPRCFGVLEFE
jgi:hypothetical protein